MKMGAISYAHEEADIKRLLAATEKIVQSGILMKWIPEELVLFSDPVDRVASNDDDHYISLEHSIIEIWYRYFCSCSNQMQ